MKVKKKNLLLLLDIEPFAKKKKFVKEDLEDTIKSPPGDPPDVSICQQIIY